MAGVWIGTSGFSYREWKPSFYPQEVSQRDFLRYYASRLGAVEIDSSFYRIPNRKTLELWREITPQGFRFALKASRKITHFERLRVPSEALDYLLDVIRVLGDRLGVLLFQLPPNFKCDLERLESFLASLDANLPYAFEFRHDSWFQQGVYSLLRRYHIALCVNESDDNRTPIEVTADCAYVRLRKSGYSADARREWQARFRAWANEGIDVFAFVKHEGNPNAPLIALEFAGLEA